MKSRKGFGVIEIVIVVAVVGVIAALGWYALGSKKSDKSTSSTAATTNSSSASTRVMWTYENNVWKPSSTPPSCPNPLLKSPVDISAATAILYPGQVRGQYKSHGGFRFDNNKSNAVTVKMPMAGHITTATRYLENIGGPAEIQYLVAFENECGIAFEFDHLRTLSAEVQAIMDTRPEAKLNDTGGLPIKDGAFFDEGAVIATEIGRKSNGNVGMDFGVYDYRQKNEASKNPAYAASHANAGYEDLYALCWLNDLPAADAVIAKSLPGGDGKMGKTSDYCK